MDEAVVGLGEETSDGVEQQDLHLLTIQVTEDQETAMEAFFQINSWQFIKEAKGESGEDTVHSLTLQVTDEQESALEAFFQINNWPLIKEVESAGADITQDGEENLFCDETEMAQEFLEKDAGDEVPIVEEVGGLREIKVTATDINGRPQVITVFAEGGNVKGLPQSLFDLSDGGETSTGKQAPQVIIQEITLPEGMSLDQGLVLANPQLQVIKRVTPRGSVKPGDKVYKCHMCDKTFKQAASFNGHYQSHFGAKPFKCEICGTGFTLKAALASHQSIHSGAKPFVCAVCNKGFRRKDDMMSHLRTHTGEKPYECDICGKKFKYRNQIPKHRRFHTGEKPYQCTTCEKRFTSNIHLTRHIRTHTGERPYKCKVCPKAFTQFGHLQAHTRIHTDERPFACEVCGRKFREKKVMKRHEQLHSSERKFKCDVCGRGFLRQSNLDLHSVMHQKGPKEGGLRRGRPKPKKRQADAEMREFVANVLSNVRKVDSSMQTDNPNPATNMVHGVKIDNTESNNDTDNLSAFVNFAVEQQNTQVAHIGDISDLQNLVNSNQQITLVMHDDGSGSYLISNCDAEEFVNQLPSQQVEISTGYNEVPVKTEILNTRAEDNSIVNTEQSGDNQVETNGQATIVEVPMV